MNVSLRNKPWGVGIFFLWGLYILRMLRFTAVMPCEILCQEVCLMNQVSERQRRVSQTVGLPIWWATLSQHTKALLYFSCFVQFGRTSITATFDVALVLLNNLLGFHWDLCFSKMNA